VVQDCNTQFVPTDSRVIRNWQSRRQREFRLTIVIDFYCSSVGVAGKSIKKVLKNYYLMRILFVK
jgi:hypothetical protein